MDHYGSKAAGLAALAAVLVAAAPAVAQQITPSQYQVQATITVVPYAELSFLGGSLLYLEIPPGGSTIPNSGVSFFVSGNTTVSLSAEPSEFVEVVTTRFYPGLGPAGTYHLGKAKRGGDHVGYDLSLDFPTGSTARLPKNVAGPTPVRTADVAPGDVYGTIDLITNSAWSNQGAIPLPGLYEGQLTINLKAN